MLCLFVFCFGLFPFLFFSFVLFLLIFFFWLFFFFISGRVIWLVCCFDFWFKCTQNNISFYVCYDLVIIFDWFKVIFCMTYLKLVAYVICTRFVQGGHGWLLISTPKRQTHFLLYFRVNTTPFYLNDQNGICVRLLQSCVLNDVYTFLCTCKYVCFTKYDKKKT